MTNRPPDSPGLQKKAVRLMTNDVDGNVTIEQASPLASQATRPQQRRRDQTLPVIGTVKPKGL